MRLPNAHLAVVEREKIAEYLLNPEHPDNGGKATFFVALGFSRDAWNTFADSLRQLALVTDVADQMETVHGKNILLTETLRIRQARQLGCAPSG